MKTLVDQLLDMLKALRTAPGVSLAALRNLLRAHAAEVIQQDPASANVPPGTDPLIEEAIRAGAEQAKALTLAGTRLRLAVEDLPLATVAADAGELRNETFGPFVEQSGRLLRFVSLLSSKFIAVNVTLAGAPIPGELQLLIPPASTPDSPTLQEWTLAPGTIWIRARFLVGGATGMAGLRIAGGKLSFVARPRRNGAAILMPFPGGWSLSVEPEQPQAGAPGAGDAEAVNLALPAQLDVHSNAAPVLRSGATVEDFGSTLTLAPGGAPSSDGHEIAFPMTIAEARWSISSNLSSLARFSGIAAPRAARWALPLSSTPANLIGEAVHGGSIVVSLDGELTSLFASQQGGASSWFVFTLTANAQRIEVDAAQAASTGRYDDLQLWGPSTSSIELSRPAVRRLFFRSERGESETVVVFGGGIQNKWDAPRRADGSAFAFEGSVETFGLLASPAGRWLTCAAKAEVATDAIGFALENLYLTVRAPNRLVAIATFDAPPALPAGVALLFFDVSLALPTLPDPYAANWGPSDAQSISASALRVVLAWEDSAAPTLSAHLDKPVRFPEPRFPAPTDRDELALYNAFRDHLGSQPEFLYLLDLSTREHLFGVAVESPSDEMPALVENRLAFRMERIRLLMQPQVQWEPLQIEENIQVPTLHREIVHSTTQGGPTFVGANSVTLVPSLPVELSEAILAAIKADQRAAALFSLPFGLRAMARLSPNAPPGGPAAPPAAITQLHEPGFGDLSSARQLRITARNNSPFPLVDPSRSIPGMLRQLGNLRPNLSNLKSVTPNELVPPLHTQFATTVPLHHADLSGYGLSSFSEWMMRAEGAGFCKVQFQVLNGRTAYEVLQFQSVLYECGARTVRTVIVERRNSGRVFRYDTGWVAVEAGLFTRPKAFEKGAVRSFQNIRRIRIAGDVIEVDPSCAVQPVIFDADVELLGRTSLVPIYDRPGYIQVKPTASSPPPLVAPPLLTDAQVKALFGRVGPIGGSIDCLVRVGGTLDMQLSSIVSDVALDDANGIGFAVAIVGTPTLPAAGQWSVMRVDPTTRDVTPVDRRRGVPLVRNGVAPYRFREPGDTRRTNPKLQHGLLMATESSRVLFAQPVIDPAHPGAIEFDVPPAVADPYSLVQATGQFPRPALALGLKEKAVFHVDADNRWRIDNPAFTLSASPDSSLMKGGEWGLSRSYNNLTPFRLAIDSAIGTPPDIAVPGSDLNLDLPKLPAALKDIFKLTGQYKTGAGGIPRLENPDLVFSGALEEVKKTLHSLSQLLGLPFNFDVSVTSGDGPTPSFVVHMSLVFIVGRGPGERVEIGVGKFYGQFTVRGELEAAPAGSGRALLAVNFQGDVQQGILPPLLYAGGLFRFGIEIRDTGSPLIELGLGVVASIGGDLIPGLLEVELTVHYGYTLIPETLQPGVLLGLDARAKLLGGLVGFGFSVEAMARLQRATPKSITIWAQIRVAATVQIAIFIEEEVDFQTQFQQEIPLAALALVPGVGLLPAATAL